MVLFLFVVMLLESHAGSGPASAADHALGARDQLGRLTRSDRHSVAHRRLPHGDPSTPRIGQSCLHAYACNLSSWPRCALVPGQAYRATECVAARSGRLIPSAQSVVCRARWTTSGVRSRSITRRGEDHDRSA